jgi:superfamily II DNA or RNA helicase
MFSSIPNRNNTNYPLSLSNVLKSIKHTDGDSLLYHQRITHDFVLNNPSTRGLIIFNETGSGKTITAASIALDMRESRDIIVLAAKSLQSNFKIDLEKYIKMGDASMTTSAINAMMDAQFNFISSNASNMMDQVAKLGKSSEEIDHEKQLGIISEAKLDGKLIIVDEAHNLFNSIVSHGKNAYRLYETIMAANDVKLIFLTGTPIVNDPFELVPAYNMCAGWEILPTDYDEFYKLFIDTESNQLINRQKFMNRIYGLTSYYGSWYQTGGRRQVNETIKRKYFPDELPLIIEKVAMSHEQYSIYKSARDIESDVTSKFKKGVKKNVAMRKPKSDGSSYRVHSRQACNYAYPSEALEKGKKNISLLTTQHLTNLDVYSPKMAKIISNIQAIPNRTQVVYSSFVSSEGIGIFARTLEVRGWHKYGSKDGGSGPRYAIFSGDINVDTRDEIVRIFNSNDNAYGKHISLLLLSGAGSEGVNIYNGAAIHIMEPYWNWNRILQVIARMVRYKGHEFFNNDVSKKQVQPYLYVSDYPDDIDKTNLKEPTTDTQLIVNSMRHRLLNERFYGAMIASSFDCPVHTGTIKCMQCSPTNVPLFHRDLDKDMSTPSPCDELKKREVDVNEITYMGKQYFYNKDEHGLINLFEFKKSLNGYVSVKPGNTAYAPIIEQLTTS